MAVKNIKFQATLRQKLPKIAEVKLSSCGLEVADLKLPTAEKIEIAEVFPLSCRVAIAD